jgi:hypothetical protein
VALAEAETTWAKDVRERRMGRVERKLNLIVEGVLAVVRGLEVDAAVFSRGEVERDEGRGGMSEHLSVEMPRSYSVL